MALRGFTDYEADGSAISGSFAAGYIYATEIFPTVVRNIGAGLSTQFANMGALIAPQLLLLTAGGAAGGEEESVAAAAACGGGDLGAVILVFGMMATLGAALVLLLPETLGAVLPDSLQDIERSGEVPRVLDWLLGSWEQADAGPVLWRARGGGGRRSRGGRGDGAPGTGGGAQLTRVGARCRCRGPSTRGVSRAPHWTSAGDSRARCRQ